jgi:hypothetical protein
LAAESPSFAKQNAEAAPAVRKLREQYALKISSLSEVKTHLDKLKARGVEPERVLKCLASFVLLEKDATWQLKADANKADLRKLAKGLRTIAKKVDGAYRADTLRPDLFALSLGFFVPTPPPYDHRKAVEYMGETAADLETTARIFGRLRKEITPAVRRKPIVRLLRHVCKQPWSVPDLQLRVILAELLDAVCEKFEIKNSFTADSLLKTFERHVLPHSPEPRLDKTPSQK